MTRAKTAKRIVLGIAGALILGGLGCELIVDYDRSKIDAGGSPAADGATADGTPNANGGTDGGGSIDAPVVRDGGGSPTPDGRVDVGPPEPGQADAAVDAPALPDASVIDAGPDAAVPPDAGPDVGVVDARGTDVGIDTGIFDAQPEAALEQTVDGAGLLTADARASRAEASSAQGCAGRQRAAPCGPRAASEVG